MERVVGVALHEVPVSDADESEVCETIEDHLKSMDKLKLREVEAEDSGE